ncbi:hypothetical protein NTGM5_510012 [Candidatus Nitrotoga sp. M5]|nr:hypothetical protein NTGM5_510012 [Candidatus Nitrotoga sp. M5]
MVSASFAATCSWPRDISWFYLDRQVGLILVLHNINTYNVKQNNITIKIW